MDLFERSSGEFDPVERIMFSLRSLYASYGYDHFHMGKFEEYDFYSRNKDFLVSDGIISFTDTNGKLMALKPDVTLSIVKNDSGSEDDVRKLYYDENVYRVSKRNNMFCEIKQAGLECIGNVDAYHLGEVLLLAAKSLAQASDSYVLAVSDLDILNAFICAFTGSEEIKRAVIKCVSEKNLHGIDEICVKNGIDAEKAAPLKALVSLYGEPSAVLEKLGEIPDSPDVKNEIALLARTLGIFDNSNFFQKIHLDFSIVSDLNYYNGIVFKGFVSAVPDSVLSGGQYDKLMEKLGRRSRAVGFAVYLDMFDRLCMTSVENDADIMLIYGGEADVAAIGRCVEKLVSEGNSVIALTKADPKLRCRKVFKFENGEVTELENNA